MAAFATPDPQQLAGVYEASYRALAPRCKAQLDASSAALCVFALGRLGTSDAEGAYVIHRFCTSLTSLLVQAGQADDGIPARFRALVDELKTDAAGMWSKLEMFVHGALGPALRSDGLKPYRLGRLIDWLRVLARAKDAIEVSRPTQALSVARYRLLCAPTLLDPMWYPLIAAYRATFAALMLGLGSVPLFEVATIEWANEVYELFRLVLTKYASRLTCISFLISNQVEPGAGILAALAAVDCWAHTLAAEVVVHRAERALLGEIALMVTLYTAAAAESADSAGTAAERQ